MSEVVSASASRIESETPSYQLSQCIADLLPIASETDGPEDIRNAATEICQHATEVQALVKDLLVLPMWLPSDARERIGHYIINRLNRVYLACSSLARIDKSIHFQKFQTSIEKMRMSLDACHAEIKLFQHVVTGLKSPSLPISGQVSEKSGTRILLVEDDPISAKYMRLHLEFSGHQIDSDDCGEDALNRLKTRRYDCVILDHNLATAMDGFTVLQAIRSDPNTKSVPVVMASAVEDMKRVVKCIDAGADDYLLKPIEPTLLRAKLRSVLYKREQQLRELEQFFPPAVARRYRDNKEEAYKPQQKELITTLFCDIRQFSAISERLRQKNNDPALSIQWINAVMVTMSECVLRHGGVIVDFLGDELFAMWGAPDDQPNQADLARTAALEMLASLPALNDEWRDRLGQDIRVGIGIHSGPGLVGNIGTPRRPKYGPNGDTVNQGSRTQGASKYLKAPLVVTAAALHEMHQPSTFQKRRLCKVKFVGIEQPISLYEIVAHTDSDDAQSHRSRFEVALGLYENAKKGKDFHEDLRKSAEILGELLKASKHDGPEVALLARVMESLMSPTRWSDVFELPGK